jgi:hypothetical protein
MNKEEIIKENIKEAKKRIQKKILIDNLLIFISRIIEDINKDPDVKLFGRAKEFYLTIKPYSEDCGNSILNFLRKSFKTKEGLVLNDEEKNFINILFNEIDKEFKLKNPNIMKGRLKGILNKICKEYLPESTKLIEPQLLTRIISAVGGIERLKDMPASTIQLIGAEKALFRHLTQGNKPPKYGLIYYSRFIQIEKNKGKKARQLSNKLAISIKVDYFNHFNKEEENY